MQRCRKWVDLVNWSIGVCVLYWPLHVDMQSLIFHTVIFLRRSTCCSSVWPNDSMVCINFTGYCYGHAMASMCNTLRVWDITHATVWIDQVFHACAYTSLTTATDALRIYNGFDVQYTQGLRHFTCCSLNRSSVPWACLYFADHCYWRFLLSWIWCPLKPLVQDATHVVRNLVLQRQCLIIQVIVALSH